MRVFLASAIVCMMALSGSAQAQTYAAPVHRTHRQAQAYDQSWGGQRAYDASAPAFGGWRQDGPTRGAGGAAWDPGSANGS